MPLRLFEEEEDDEDEIEDILRKARAGAGNAVEQGAPRAGVRVRGEHAAGFTVSGEHAAVIVCNRGGLGATSVNTADGAVSGVDTIRESSGDSWGFGDKLVLETVERSSSSIWARSSCRALGVRCCTVARVVGEVHFI